MTVEKYKKKGSELKIMKKVANNKNTLMMCEDVDESKLELCGN